MVLIEPVLIEPVLIEPVLIEPVVIDRRVVGWDQVGPHWLSGQPLGTGSPSGWHGR
ncbi:MAG: hypothetical protein M3Y48_15935 [Actinomycetota bacterium]|nr:hypothetical protein [Actinomycetota bacterium]